MTTGKKILYYFICGSVFVGYVLAIVGHFLFALW